MKTDLEAEAAELGRIVERTIAKAGGTDLVHRAESGESVSAEIAEMLNGLGLWELMPRSEQIDCEAAAAACRAGGRFALPYPVAERLSGDRTAGVDAVAVVNPHTPRVDHFVSDLSWTASDGNGRHAVITDAGEPLGSKLGALVSDVQLGDWDGPDDLAPLALTLPCWTLLGMCEAAFAQTRQHLLDRHQFGQALAGFQALQFRMADTASSLQAFAELAKYTVWSVGTGQPGRLGDALALRFSALETAEALFRTCHQMHGAMGFCDEVPLSWLSRYSQPIRRLPWGRSETEARLLQSMESVPFAGLFSGSDDVNAILVQ